MCFVKEVGRHVVCCVYMEPMMLGNVASGGI